ncbi:hypothetical protein [Acidianus infernus]|uniref:hypothetical protein n=1 Tax=Acidianus infernus TaxID=12915 RepID=UPI00359469F8
MIGKILVSSAFITLIGLGVIYFTLSSLYSSLCYAKIIQFNEFAYKYVKYNATEFLYNGSVFLCYSINASKLVYVEGILNCGFKEIVKICKLVYGYLRCFKRIPGIANVTYLKILIGNYSEFKCVKPRIENAIIKLKGEILNCDSILKYIVTNCGNVPIYLLKLYVHMVCEECVKEGNMTVTKYVYKDYNISVNNWLDPGKIYRYCTLICKLVCASITLCYKAICNTMYSTVNT